jgi:hypothetical protein
VYCEITWVSPILSQTAVGWLWNLSKLEHTGSMIIIIAMDVPKGGKGRDELLVVYTF